MWQYVSITALYNYCETNGFKNDLCNGYNGIHINVRRIKYVM